MIDAEDESRGFGAPRPQQTRETEDLSLGDVEVDWFDGAFAAHAARLNKGVSFALRAASRNGVEVQFAEFAAHHFGDELEAGQRRGLNSPTSLPLRSTVMRSDT